MVGETPREGKGIIERGTQAIFFRVSKSWRGGYKTGVKIGRRNEAKGGKKGY